VAESAVVVVGAANVLRVRPFAVCKAQAELLTSAPGTVLTFSFGKNDGGCGGGPPGTFGLIDLDGAVSGGANDLKSRVQYGYDEAVQPFDAIISENGNEYTSLPMDTLMDVRFPMPVYDSYGSAGKTYHGIGYVTVKACAWGQGHDSPTYKGSCYNALNYTAKADTVGSKDWLMQVEYVNYTPQAKLNASCTLSDDTCDSGKRVAALAD
jgi:hypothetical protein